jgi:hypothetical protein
VGPEDCREETRELAKSRRQKGIVAPLANLVADRGVSRGGEIAEV